MASIRELLTQTRTALSNSPSATLDAEVLLCHVLECERSYLFTWPEKNIAAEHEQHFLELIAQRAQGTPVAYITGEREFWSLPLQVNSETLIPRPETELLVDAVLSRFTNTKLEVLDLGTGSGAIAIALAHSRPGWQVTACDISADCIEVATRNAAQLNLNNIELLQSDWFENLQGRRFDLIVSNPPYIAEHDPHLGQGDVRFEPARALSSGSDGLDAIRQLCAQAGTALKSDGWFFTEHGYDQKAAVGEYFQQHGFSDILQLDDLGGQPRLSAGRLANPKATGQ